MDIKKKNKKNDRNFDRVRISKFRLIIIIIKYFFFIFFFKLNFHVLDIHNT